MATPRRFLPPTLLLHSFEAAARLQSFTAAARELHLTQSAISRHIRALEQQLGAELFVRDRQTVRLTLAGAAYAREIRDALRHIATATLGFRANPTGGTVNLGVLPTFGAHWLAPRLPDFMGEHPDITINLMSRPLPFDFSGDTLHAAIHFGAAEWTGADMDFLMSEQIVATCSPALLARHAFRTPADLLEAPLLHLVSRPDAWERWFAAQGLEAQKVHGMLCDQFTFIAQAAAAGAGVALLPRFLVSDLLESGRLVELPGRTLHSDGAYYLAYPQNHGGYGPLQTFRAWLLKTAGRVPAMPKLSIPF
ncbi:LysR family transcriptional regulator [Gluconacetobacter sacchari DSM 12717]|uniref:LysR family transcriptional regulator n=3 Tax=Gluconacetobacter sacchari TaxID=92759 RepID=A0A7W4NP02_9PROT|nr:LysR family transcriptional regulator [Gluconacetobacter sacchari]GBQ24002.1 LysR family transcriptional regulator [Gluconacetobacter sacchari DSM 12717]